MKGRTAFILLLLFTLSISIACSAPPKPTPEEKAVLDSLTTLQKGYDRRITVDEFALLLSAASNNIEQLKNGGKGNSCFLNAAKRCYSSYEISQKAWKLMEKAPDGSRRVDLETTLSFTIGFASISLAKANECFSQR
jgi:hypothetical protein